MEMYIVEPIDFGWERLRTVAETIADMSKDKSNSIDEYRYDELLKFITLWQVSLVFIKDKHWEGDFRDEPRVFWIPHDNKFLYGFVFKQENDGLTFIISPEPMPWIVEANYGQYK